MILLAAGMATLVVLGIVQGLTEFLPVSSSGHLVLFGEWLAVEEDGLTVEVALHLGTLVSVMAFCWKDLLAMLRQGSAALWRLVLGSTVFTVGVALAVGGSVEEHLTSSVPAGCGLLVTAALLGAVAPTTDDRLNRRLDSGTWRDAVILGVFQSLALAPGVSRAGATIVAALLLGFERREAVRIAFLMSIPVVAGAVLRTALDGVSGPVMTRPDVIAGMVAAGVVGLGALRFISRNVHSRSLRFFAAYCAVLGVVAILIGLPG